MQGSPGSLRRLNERVVFDRLRRGGPASRAALAKATGLSAPTVGKLVDGLLRGGLVRELDAPGDEDAPVLGRPGRMVALDDVRPRIAAVQLGVHHTRLAALPIAGPDDDRWAVRFATPRRAATWSRRLRAAAADLSLREPWAVVVSVPGVVDELAGRVLLSPNLHWTERADLGQLVADVWRAPVRFVQEIRALAMGHLAAAPGLGDFLLVDFGAGVGGALVRHGRVYDAPLALAGELGHTPVAGNDRLCGCGAVGCVETLASRDGMLMSLATQHGKRRAGWRQLVKHVEAHGIEPWLKRSLDAAGTTIGGALNVVGVRHVVVTGSLTELPDGVMHYLGEAVERAAMWARFGQVVCTAAPRRRAAGLAAAAIDQLILPRTDTMTALADAADSYRSAGP